MAAGATCNENHQDKWPLDATLFCTLNLAKYCTSILLKDSSISPETWVLWKNLFPPGEDDDAQGLFECQCLSFVSYELKRWAKSSAYVWLNTTLIGLKEKIPIDRDNQTDPNTNKSTLMNMMPSYSSEHPSLVLNSKPFLWFISWKKGPDFKEQTFNKIDSPSFKLFQVLCYKVSLAEASIFLPFEPWCSFTCFICIY